MNNNLVPVPIVDKNGKLTTVHKRAASGGVSSSVLAGVAPVASAPVVRSSDSLFPVLEPLSAEETAAVLTEPEASSGRFVFEKLPLETQALFVHFAAKWDLSSDCQRIILLEMENRFVRVSTFSRVSGEASEQHLRNMMLVVDYIQSRYPVTAHDMRYNYYLNNLSGALEGCYYRGKGEVSAPLVLSTPDEVAEVAAVCAYITTLGRLDDRRAFRKRDHVVVRDLKNAADSRETGLGIKSRSIETFVRSRPELACRIAEFVRDREIGNSKAEAQTVIDRFDGTLETTPVSTGWL